MDVINLGIGAPDFKTPENIIDAGCKALRDGYHFYTPAKGILELREAVSSDIHKYRQVDVNPENIIKALFISTFASMGTIFFAIKYLTL